MQASVLATKTAETCGNDIGPPETALNHSLSMSVDAPITRLPDELLFKIFVQLRNIWRTAATVCPGNDIGWLTAVTQVCHRWRKVSLSSPLLWRWLSVQLMNQRDRKSVEAFLAASCQVGLIVDIWLPLYSGLHQGTSQQKYLASTENGYPQGWDLISRESHRIQDIELCLEFTTREGSEDLVSWTPSRCSFPSLRNLTIYPRTPSSTHDRELTIDLLPPFLPPDKLPMLETLHTRSIQFNVLRPYFSSGLRYLALFDLSESHLEWGHLFSALQNLKALEELFLTGYFPRAPEWSGNHDLTSHEAIAFPALVRLVFHARGDNGSRVTFFLRNIIAPTTACFILVYGVRNSSTAQDLLEKRILLRTARTISSKLSRESIRQPTSDDLLVLSIGPVSIASEANNLAAGCSMNVMGWSTTWAPSPGIGFREYLGEFNCKIQGKTPRLMLYVHKRCATDFEAHLRNIRALRTIRTLIVHNHDKAPELVIQPPDAAFAH